MTAERDRAGQARLPSTAGGSCRDRSGRCASTRATCGTDPEIADLLPPIDTIVLTRVERGACEMDTAQLLRSILDRGGNLVHRIGTHDQQLCACKLKLVGCLP